MKFSPNLKLLTIKKAESNVHSVKDKRFPWRQEMFSNSFFHFSSNLGHAISQPGRFRAGAIRMVAALALKCIFCNRKSLHYGIHAMLILSVCITIEDFILKQLFPILFPKCLVFKIFWIKKNLNISYLLNPEVTNWPWGRQSDVSEAK